MTNDSRLAWLGTPNCCRTSRNLGLGGLHEIEKAHSKGEEVVEEAADHQAQDVPGHISVVDVPVVDDRHQPERVADKK